MIKNIFQIEATVDGKTGRFLVDNETPIGIAKEILFQFLKYIGQLEDKIKDQQKPQENTVPTPEMPCADLAVQKE